MAVYGVDTYGVGTYGSPLAPVVTTPNLTIPFTVGTGQIVGQGLYPKVRCRVAFGDVSVAIPNWIELDDQRVRAFATSRGRSSELAAFDSGTATVTLQNRDRAFDPTNVASPYYPNVTPMMRLWLYEEFAGEAHTFFRGYVENLDQQWPGGGWSDAVVILTCADEFKLLALDSLPITSPDRASFEEVVASDMPDGYWRMNTNPTQRIQPAVQTAATSATPNPYVPSGYGVGSDLLGSTYGPRPVRGL